MRLFFLSLTLSLLVTSAFSQWGDNYIQLSKKVTTETRSISGFDKINVSEDFKVFIHFSDAAEKVEIQANENLHDLIQVENDNGTLKIYTKSYSTSYNNKSKKRNVKERLVAHITAKSLTEIRGDEDVIIVLEDNMKADKLTIDLNEDSKLEGYIEVNDLIVKLDEDSVLDIEGSAHTMKVKADEDSILKGFDFVVDELDIDLNEDSMAKLTVNGEINLRAREDSYFYHKGKGSFVRKRLTGDSEIKNW